MLSLVMLTKDSGHRVGKVLQQARYYADKIYVLVDAQTTDNTEEVCREYADYVEVIETAGYIEPSLPYLYELPDTEWILRLDDDETVGERFIDNLGGLMEQGADAWWLPRYNMVSPLKYLSGNPMYPDYQLRLFRKGAITPRTEIHHTPKIHGRAGETNTHIFHWKYLEKGRAEREALAKRYDEIHEGAGSLPEYAVHQVPEAHYRGVAKFIDEFPITDTAVFNLGCGGRPKKYAMNLDVVGVDKYYPDRFKGIRFAISDLNNLPWYFSSEVADCLIMEDVLEHLTAPTIDIMNEAWRVLKPGGMLRIRCPSALQYGTYQDMTHTKFLTKDSFWHLDPDHEFGKEFAHYTPFKWKILRAEDVPGSFNFIVWMQKREG